MLGLPAVELPGESRQLVDANGARGQRATVDGTISERTPDADELGVRRGRSADDDEFTALSMRVVAALASDLFFSHRRVNSDVGAHRTASR